MEIRLYTTSDPHNKIGKTLLNESIYNITLKDVADILAPSIRINSDTPILANYAYIPDFERYYFVGNIVISSKRIYTLNLECDVLESFKTDILTSYGLITRTEQGNVFFDGDLNSEVRKEVDTFESNVTPALDPSIVLVTIK